MPTDTPPTPAPAPVDHPDGTDTFNGTDGTDNLDGFDGLDTFDGVGGFVEAGGAVAETGLLAPVWAGTPVWAATSDRAWLAGMLRAEAALARAQAELGTVPAAAARAITAAAAHERLDLVALGAACRESANPVVPLVRQFTAQVAARDAAAAAYVHRGSTSQDILDTATVLVAGHALALVRADLARVEQALAGLARAHRGTVMAGRTLALHAVPTTFGLKAAGWRHLVLDAVDRLDAAAGSALVVQLGGAAGTLAGYLQHAPGVPASTYARDLPAAFAAQLGLSAPLLPWHVLRTPIADLAGAAAFVCGALGKIAVDVLSMARTEVGEVAEPAPAGRGASSAMPHKRNPVLATAIRSAALQAPQLAATVWACLPSEDERSAGAWHAEWEPLRGLLRLAGGAARQAVELTGHLHVDAERMAANADLTAGQIVSEKVAAHLAATIGKDAARALLGAASRASAATGRPLAPALADAVAGLPAGERDAAAAALAAAPGDLFAPAAYLGAAPDLTDAALSRTLPPPPRALTRIRGAATRSG